MSKYNIVVNENELERIARWRIGKKYDGYINRMSLIALFGVLFGILPSAIMLDQNNSDSVQGAFSAIVLIGGIAIAITYLYKMYSSIEKEKKHNVSKMIREAHQIDDEM